MRCERYENNEIEFPYFLMLGETKSTCRAEIENQIESDKFASAVYTQYGFYNDCANIEWGRLNQLWVMKSGEVAPLWFFIKANPLDKNGRQSLIKFRVADYIDNYDKSELDGLSERFSLLCWYNKRLNRGEALTNEEIEDYLSFSSRWENLDPIEKNLVLHLRASSKRTFEEVFHRLNMMITYNRNFKDYDPLWFITFTFSDEYLMTLEDGSRDFRPFVFDKVQRFCNSFLGENWILNVDYGSETDRPHFHGVFNALPFGAHSCRLSKKDLKSVRALFLEWFPGCINGIHIEPVNITLEDKKRICHYVTKLSHHATKKTALRGHRIMYSKNLTEWRQMEKKGFTLA